VTKKLNVLSIFAVIALLIFPAQGGAASPTLPNSPQSAISAANSNSDQKIIAAAIDAAFAGSDRDLVSLLHSPKAGGTRTALRARLEARGDFQFIPPRESGVTLAPMSTGQYDYYCTSYAGVTMGWDGKVVEACHGWMDVYISGRHVAHFSPDLVPVGPGVSVQCTVAVIGTTATLISLPAGGAAGWAVYGIGAIAGGAGVVWSCG
jgi:hypothetical protein